MIFLKSLKSIFKNDHNFFHFSKFKQACNRYNKNNIKINFLIVFTNNRIISAALLNSYHKSDKISTIFILSSILLFVGLNSNQIGYNSIYCDDYKSFLPQRKISRKTSIDTHTTQQWYYYKGKFTKSQLDKVNSDVFIIACQEQPLAEDLVKYLGLPLTDVKIGQNLIIFFINSQF